MEGGTDRGLALTCASMLEAALEDLLSASLIDHSVTRDLLRGPGQALSGLASRISVAFAMGIITASDRISLEIVRDLAAEAACGGRFEIGASEHLTRIRDAHSRAGAGDVSAEREWLLHITTKCLSGIHDAIRSIGDGRAVIRKNY